MSATGRGAVSRPDDSVKHGRSTPHWMTKTAAYTSWRGMKARCTNSGHDRYRYYGGRGIGVCDRWINFSAFLKDMGERPHASSLDRIDNDGDYCPENCRWATKAEQVRNCRSNRLISFRGRTLTLAQWAEETGMHRETISGRLDDGWSPARALTEPPRKVNHPLYTQPQEAVR